MNEFLFFTQQEIANALKVSTKTLESMRQKGTGPLFKKFGRRVLYAQADVQAFLDERSFRSTSEY
jgi:hypothetical protein